MEHFVSFQNTSICYFEKGNGRPIVLLHGYLESKEIWSDFANDLSSQFRIVAVDLLGHGKSGIVGAIHTMELMADAVKAVLDHLDIQHCAIIGHSMGGYVVLNLAEKYPSFISCLCLLHSTPNADTEEKKKNRSKEIELIQQGRKDLIVNINIPNAFATDNLQELQEQINFTKDIAIKTTNEGIIAALEGMKLRADKKDFLVNTLMPILFIFGEKDNYILLPIIEKFIHLPRNKEILILCKSGHMGFLEEKEKVIEKICTFTQSAFKLYSD